MSDFGLCFSALKKKVAKYSPLVRHEQNKFEFCLSEETLFICTPTDFLVVVFSGIFYIIAKIVSVHDRQRFKI